ncbi:MAG: hypothetical protein R2818_04625 [Flavobacteriales bacterium]
MALVNFRTHVLEDMQSANIDQYFLLGGKLNSMPWRTYEPEGVFTNVEGMVMRRLGMSVRNMHLTLAAPHSHRITLHQSRWK